MFKDSNIFVICYTVLYYDPGLNSAAHTVLIYLNNLCKIILFLNGQFQRVI